MKNIHILLYTAAFLFAAGAVLSFIEGGFLPGAVGILAAVALYLTGAKQKTRQG
jgi:hypothetical protein